MELHNFSLMLAAVLLAARFFSEVAVRLGVSAVIGELAAGLIIGPSLLGWVAPRAKLSNASCIFRLVARCQPTWFSNIFGRNG